MPTLHRRSYWRAEYVDRAPIDERSCDWIQLPRRGLVQLALVCPNGKMGVLGHSSGQLDHRAFQFKIAHADVGLGGGGERATDAQVIGVLVDAVSGRCVCYAWEYGPRRLVGPFEDHLFDFAYGGGVLRHPSLTVLLGTDHP
jgi:hypothetical protein